MLSLLDKVLLARYTTSMTKIADFLKDIQRQRGFSLRRLARETQISASTLSRWRDGKQTPSPESCRLLADYLSLPAEHILALAGHLSPLHRRDDLPEFREYAGLRYPNELDEDIVAMIEDLIRRRRGRLAQGG